MTDSSRSFLVMALPRSRTAWLSRFLSYREWHCGHDQLQYVRSLDDVKAWLSQPKTGSSETAAAPFWRLLLKYAPDIRIVTIRRPVAEVVESLCAAGLCAERSVTREVMTSLDRKLDQIEGRVPGVLSVTFADLEQEDVCAQIFGHCLPFEHDHNWWSALKAQNIQINLAAQIRYARANAAEIARVSSLAREAMLKNLGLRPAAEGELVIREEAFDDLVRDAEELFRRHCSEVGESADNWMEKNIPLMQMLNRTGYYQVMVARCNGRVFGYLTSVISPSLESEKMIVAEHRMFYAAEEFHGLGLKLQRAALKTLRAKGVKEVYMRAGVRGSGRRLGTLYRRVGAQDFGQMYRIDLEA